MPALPAVVVASLLAAAGSAPAPAAAPSRAAALDEMFAAERAFSARAGVVGVRDSFLEFFAPDAVAFNPNAHAAVPELRARPSSATAQRKAVLEWGPTHGDMAASADLGWDTGPFVVKEIASGNAIDRGYFFSIWRRQADGTLKVEVDAGLDVAAADETGTTAAPPGPVPSGEVDAAATRAALGRRDQQLTTALGRSCDTPVPVSFYAANVRLHRSGKPPILGRAAALREVGPPANPVGGGSMPCSPPQFTATPYSSGVSRAGDLGYTISRIARGTDDPGAWAVRVWRWSANGWEVVFDTLLPVPPPPAAPPAPPAPPAPAAPPPPGG